MIYIAWIAVAVVLAWGFSEYLDRVRNPNQFVQSRTSGDGNVEVVLRRNRAGHYVASGFVNGRSVEFLLDTGATNVSISGDLAQDLSLVRGASVLTQTAAGLIETYATVLDRVRLGAIELRDVRANINPHMQGREVLLGMAFLKQLQFEQRGEELVIRRPSRR